MAFCPKCGAQVEDGTAFCPSCGAPLAAPQAEAPKTEQAFTDKVAALNNTPDSTAEFDPQDIEKNKVFALLSYLGLLFLVPLLAAKDSKFARFHANQGLVLFLAEIVLSVVNVIPVLGCIVSGIGSIAVLVLAILGIINAAQGKAKELPVIGKFKLLK